MEGSFNFEGTPPKQETVSVQPPDLLVITGIISRLQAAAQKLLNDIFGNLQIGPTDNLHSDCLKEVLGAVDPSHRR